MEFLFLLLLLGVIVYVAIGISGRAHKETKYREIPPPPPPVIRPNPKPKTSTPFKAPAHPKTDMPVIEGRAYVVDGDSIVINKTQIRIYGVDAPELNHPYGKKAKWAMVALCKGQNIRAKIVETDDHGRTVAMCYLPDGRDLSEEMVKQGLALDWPKYSGGDYRMFEPDGVRKKLWLADARQKGRMHVWAQFDARQKEQAAQAK